MERERALKRPAWPQLYSTFCTWWIPARLSLSVFVLAISAGAMVGVLMMPVLAQRSGLEYRVSDQARRLDNIDAEKIPERLVRIETEISSVKTLLLTLGAPIFVLSIEGVIRLIWAAARRKD